MSCVQEGVAMEETDIRKYAGLMKELGLTGLEITLDNKVVRLERSVASAAVEPFPVQGPASQRTGEKGSGEYISIKSPIVGMFYAAPAENAEPFVSVGDSVQKGKVLCIVEAMKMMNEVSADEDGIVEEICVQNGQIVEYGTELFRLKRVKRNG